MKPVPHGEPYAGKLHVRFDEGYPPKNGEDGIALFTTWKVRFV